MNAISDSLSDLASSGNGEDGAAEDVDEEHPQPGKLSKDDEPTLVMATKSKMIQHWMVCFRQKQMKQDKLMLPGWGGPAYYFRARY